MALITHVSAIKNSNYNDSIEYLTKQHNEIRNDFGDIVEYEPIYNDRGELVEREDFALTYILPNGEVGDPDNWNRDCIETAIRHKKCLKEKERKIHHYVISHPAEDKEKGLTKDIAHASVLQYCRKNFPGHRALICTHMDTDNIHTHIILQAVLDRDIAPQSWMEKGKDGKILPSQYKAGGKYTDTPKRQYHLMKEIDDMTRSFPQGMVTENFSKKKPPTYAQKRIKFMHDEVLAAAKRAQNLTELNYILKQKNGLRVEIRGSSIRVFHPKLEKPKRIEHIGLVPYDLTPDLYKFQDQNPERYENVHEKWADEERRYEIARIKKAAKEEEMMYAPKGWTDKRGRQLRISMWNNDGERRSLLESIFILAIMAINKEAAEDLFGSEYIPTKKQKVVVIIKSEDQRIRNFKRALRYIKELAVNSEADLQKLLDRKDVSDSEKNKGKYILEKLKKAKSKEYCFDKENETEKEKKPKSHEKTRL